MRHGPAHTVTVVSLSILLGGQSALLHAQATFNMDLLEKNDHLPAVDLQRFNQQAGQPPGADVHAAFQHQIVIALGAALAGTLAGA